MAANKHIERIGDTEANIRANLDTLQIAVETDDEQTLVWANDGASRFYYAAPQYWKTAAGAKSWVNVEFNRITANENLYCNEYIYRRGDVADNILLQNDKITISAGSVASIFVEPNRVQTAVSLGVGGNAKSSILTVDGTMQLAEQAAADADDAGYGKFWVKNDAPCVPMFTNDIGTDFQISTLSSLYAEMKMYEAGQAVTINTSGVYHGVYGYSTGIVNGWTFAAGRQVDANITSEADNGGTLRIVTSVAHNLTTGDIVTCTNMNDAGHNKPTAVTVVDATTFDCDDIAYVAGAGASAGVIDEPSYLEAGAGSAGVYSCSMSVTGDSDNNNKIFKWEMYTNATEEDTIVAERNYAVGNDLGTVACTGFVTVSEGDRVWLAVENNTDTDNFEIAHSNINLHRL